MEYLRILHYIDPDPQLRFFTIFPLKGQSNEIFFHIQPAWATDQWDKVFSIFRKNLPRLS